MKDKSVLTYIIYYYTNKIIHLFKLIINVREVNFHSKHQCTDKKG